MISSHHTVVTSPAGAVTKYCDEDVCVCLSVREDISGTTRPIFTNFSAHVAYGRDSVLFQQGDKSQGKWAVWGFSSPLTMRCTSDYLGPTQKRQPIQMPFGIITRVPRRCHVLDWGPDPTRGRGNFGENVAAHCKVLGHSTVSCARTAQQWLR